MTERLQPQAADSGQSDSEWQVQQDQMARQRLEQEQATANKQREVSERERYNRRRHLCWPELGDLVGVGIGWFVTCIVIYFVIGVPTHVDTNKSAQPFIIGLYILAGPVWMFFAITEKGGRR